VGISLLKTWIFKRRFHYGNDIYKAISKVFCKMISLIRYWQHDATQVIHQFYEHLLAQGKLKKVALVAWMRKLWMILNAMIRSNQTWQSPA
jgi:hypothetical protein